MSGRPDRVKVKLACGRHEHDLCVTVDRGLPPDLRCADGQDAGYGPGGGGGCSIPRDLAERVKRELRDNFQSSKRAGYVLIRAA